MVKKINLFNRFEIKLTNKWLYSFIALGVVLILGVGVYATWANHVTHVGHSWDEIEPCDNGKILQTNAVGNWVCVNMPVDTNTHFWKEIGSDVYYNTGNVGIGTSNPSAKLHIAGDAKVNGNLIVNQDAFFDKVFSVTGTIANGKIICSEGIEYNDNSFNCLSPRIYFWDASGSGEIVGAGLSSPPDDMSQSLVCLALGGSLSSSSDCVSTVGCVASYFDDGFGQWVNTGGQHCCDKVICDYLPGINPSEGGEGPI